MFTEVLSKNAKEILAILGKSKILEKAYLGGGTGAALHLGHRVSVDLDFFTPEDFDPRLAAKEISNIGTFRLEQASKKTVLGLFRGIRFSLFYYPYPVLFPFVNFCGIKILDLRDIGVMKIDAVATRGTKRDFIDLYLICTKSTLLKDLLLLYDKKFKKLAMNYVHIKKSLVYFVDAEGDEPPQMLKKVDWNRIKEFFEDEVKCLK